jgi:hypothetical protein
LAFSVQFAYGRIRWQILGSCIFGALWIPGGYLAARYAGAVGTGWIWLLCNAAYLTIWLSYIHARLLAGFWRRWLAFDVGAVILAEGAALAAAGWIGLPSTGRAQVLGAIAATVLIAASIGVMVAPQARSQGVDLVQWIRLAISRQHSK